MSVQPIHRFTCGRCRERVDLEEGLEPDDWRRVNITSGCITDLKEGLDADYDDLLCDQCCAVLHQLLLNPESRVVDTATSMGVKIGDIPPEKIKAAVEDLVEYYQSVREADRDEFDFGTALHEALLGEEGPDDGHTFRIVHQVRGSSMVTGDDHYRDSQEFSDACAVEVRAWSLKDALHKMAELPFAILMADNIQREADIDTRLEERAEMVGDLTPANPSMWLEDALRTLAKGRDLSYSAVVNSASELTQRLANRLAQERDAMDAEFEKVGEDTDMHYEVGGFAACKIEGPEFVTTAPRKVTCQECIKVMAMDSADALHEADKKAHVERHEDLERNFERRDGSTAVAQPVMHLEDIDGPACEAETGFVSRESKEVTCEDCKVIIEQIVQDALESVIRTEMAEPQDIRGESVDSPDSASPYIGSAMGRAIADAEDRRSRREWEEEQRFPKLVHLSTRGGNDQIRGACGAGFFDYDPQYPVGWTTDPHKIECQRCQDVYDNLGADIVPVEGAYWRVPAGACPPDAVRNNNLEIIPADDESDAWVLCRDVMVIRRTQQFIPWEGPYVAQGVE